jgi:nitrogenase iron protein NifH
MNLLGGEPVQPVMDYMRQYDREPERLDEIVREGFGHVLCIETGGPTPGLGCAGRGILTTFKLLEDLKLFETAKPDVVLYDVLGDVVCGGFAAPIREGYAEKVLIVTSGEKMALYAANNIASAVQEFFRPQLCHRPRHHPQPPRRGGRGGEGAGLFEKVPGHPHRRGHPPQPGYPAL